MNNTIVIAKQSGSYGKLLEATRSEDGNIYITVEGVLPSQFWNLWMKYEDDAMVCLFLLIGKLVKFKTIEYKDIKTDLTVSIEIIAFKPGYGTNLKSILNDLKNSYTKYSIEYDKELKVGK